MTYRSKTRKGIFKSEVNEVEALKDINLDIEEETIFGLLGPNGAGKTTLIKCLTTLLIPTEGNAIINGFDIREDEKEVRASIGAMLMGERGLYWKLTAKENLDYFGKLYSIPGSKREERIDELISLLELGEFADRPVESYSSGQKMKTAFAKCMIHDPPILFLDEPTIAMDVQGARKLRQIVKNLPEEGKTVIYTTHLMHEAHELCDDLGIIDKGEIIERGKPQQLIDQSSIDTIIEIETGNSSNGNLKDILAKQDYLRNLNVIDEKSESTRYQLNVKGNSDVLPQLTKLMHDQQIDLHAIEQHHPSLEDVFVELTGRSLSEDTREEI